MIIDSAVITGSLVVSGSKIQSGDFNINGNLTVTGSLSVNGSNAVLSNQTGSFSTNTSLNSYTSSINAFSASVLSYTASNNTTNTTQNNRLTGLESYTSSLNTATSSFVRNNQTSSFVQNSQTSSFVQNAQTGAFATFTAFNSYTSSNDTTNTTQNNRIAGLESYTSSINTATSSFVRNNQTSSMSVNSASYAATASFAGNFTVASTLTAQTLVVQTVSSSVVYSSGSNVFGNSLANTQVLTGSVIITGSASVNGSNVVLTNQTASLASLNSYTSSNDTTNTTQNSRIAGLESYTSSLNTTTSSFVRNSQTSSMSVATAASASNITNAITNAADNRVLTANGGGTINGENTLTFDGSTLGISSTGGNRATINLVSSTSVPNDLYFGSNGSQHWSISTREHTNPFFGLYNVGVGNWTYTVAYSTNAVTFTTDIRSPIFYDSQNTSYYLDADSTSDSALRIRGGALHGPNVTWGDYLLVGGDGRQNYTNNATVASVCTTDGNLHLDAASGHTTYINYYDGDVVYFGNGGSSIVSSINNDGSHRPQIIYDYNNTGYYCDPASTSKINEIWSGAPDGNSTSPRWDTSFYVMQSQHWYSHNGAQTMYLGESGDFVYIRGYSTADGSFRAPIFYDSNDTGRYLDPNGTSRFGTTNQYVLELFHTISNGDFNDALFVQNLSSGQRVQIGMSTTDTDGSHHRVTLRAYKGSGTYEGQFRIALRQAGSANHTERLTLTAAGTLTVDGDLVAYSDSRVKENIKTIENSLEKVLSLRGVSYTRTDMDDTSTKIGVIAQETQLIVPEVVHEQENGMLGVAYGNMAGLFIEAIKEQQKQIDELKELVNKLLNK